jgi:hypothetical protein
MSTKIINFLTLRSTLFLSVSCSQHIFFLFCYVGNISLLFQHITSTVQYYSADAEYWMLFQTHINLKNKGCVIGSFHGSVAEHPE